MSADTAPARTPTAAVPQPASKALGWLLLVAGGIALAASATLTLEKLQLLTDPHYVPSCNINPIISCGSVMRTAQASVFGFPNPLIGLAAFPVVVTLGVVVLAGVRLPRGLWLGLQTGLLAGVGFVHWLIFQTLYRIGAVCPYCTVVWATTITLFWYVTLHNLRTGVIPVPARRRAGVDALARWHWIVPAAWCLFIALLVLNRFWYYWQTLL